uniref:Zinc knuckle family protein n=1 Tax=Solanum tuberosum TaxID=4113 RepID=M1DP59_SOLTU
MNISRLMVYSQSIEESKLKRRNRELKRSRSDEQGQPRFQKRALNQDSSSTPRVNQEKGSGPPFSKPSCHNYGKKYHGKCLAGTSGSYGCGKNDHQVKDCPTLTAKGREAKHASLNGPDLDAPKKNRFNALQANKHKGAYPDEGTN